MTDNPGVKKVFHITTNTGPHKYVVNFWNGDSKDGEYIFAHRFFNNQKKLSNFIQSLKRRGYQNVKGKYVLVNKTIGEKNDRQSNRNFWS